MIFLTGITGLVGSQVAITLLAGKEGVIALARGKAGLCADERVRKILTAHPAHAYDAFSLSRLAVLDGDLLAPECGLNGQIMALENQAHSFIHAAAVVEFAPSSDGLLDSVNVQGAINAAELAARLGCKRFVYVSTAFLDQALAGGKCRTPYEKSKLAGEVAVRRTCAKHGMACAVARPAIVTGDRVYGFTPVFKGAYPFFRYLARATIELGQMPDLPCGISEDMRINLVPADDVAAILAALALAGGEGDFNIISSEPWSAGAIMRIARRLAGVDAPSAPSSNRHSALLSQTADELVREYSCYLGVNPALDTQQTDELRKKHKLPAPTFDAGWIEAVLRWGLRRNWEGF